ncbi:MAG: class I SAM-dependent methyltransferase [Oscillospiraceae bacterium]
MDALKREWQNPAESGEIQARIWDRAAEEYANKPIPAFETDSLLRLLDEKHILTPETKALDIGCGAGLYSIALAGRVKSAVGVDISPLMARYGSRRAESLGLSNVALSQLNWAEADIDRLGFRGAFDLVFANMTPAINDYSGFEKMNLCSSAHCVMVKPTRRRDKIQDAALALIGITGQRERFDDTVLNAFSYLWQSGCCPELSYRKECWRPVKTLESMAAWCIDRAKLRRTLSAADEACVRDYLRSVSEDGMIYETVDTTIVTMYWHI